MVTRWTHLFAPEDTTFRFRPLPSAYMPGLLTVRTIAAERACCFRFPGICTSGPVYLKVYQDLPDYSGCPWTLQDLN